ncbi:MAG: hypothetical protein ABJR05_02975 [Balneola sp.]
MEFLNVLTRDEMNNVTGGTGCSGSHLCIVCTTPGGTGSWCRPNGEGDATSECQAIYPAYNPSNVSGEWATCSGVGEA